MSGEWEQYLYGQRRLYFKKRNRKLKNFNYLRYVLRRWADEVNKDLRDFYRLKNTHKRSPVYKQKGLLFKYNRSKGLHMLRRFG